MPIEGTWAVVSAGFLHACGVKLADRFLYCWGNNMDGQLGTGDRVGQNVPTLIS